MAKNVKERNALRDAYTAKVEQMFAEHEDVLRVASNRIAFPVVDAAGGEWFVTITVAIPTGERNGDVYDGYGEAEAYKLKCANKAFAKAEREKNKKGK